MCEKRTERLNIRCTKEEKEKLDKIKSETGKSISEILLSSLDPKVSEKEYLGLCKLQTKYIEIVNSSKTQKHEKVQANIKLALLTEIFHDLEGK